MCSRRGNALLTDQLVVGPDRRRRGAAVSTHNAFLRQRDYAVPAYILIPTNHNIEHNICIMCYYYYSTECSSNRNPDRSDGERNSSLPLHVFDQHSSYISIIIHRLNLINQFQTYTAVITTAQTFYTFLNMRSA